MFIKLARAIGQIILTLFIAGGIPMLALATAIYFSEPINQSAKRQNVLSAFESQLKPTYYEPKKVVIESLGITLPVQRVGVSEDGTMQTPNNWAEAGWYSKGAKAGESGNVVINAHYDDNYGRPAAFWELKNIKPDARVTLVDELGRSYTYVVREVLFLEIADPNRLNVVRDTEGASELTMITCGGVWLPGEATYDKRLVVKAALTSR